jgi:hypothetical protein
MTFGVDPDTHIDTTEQAKASTIEGTSKWSCKLSITGRRKILTNLFTFHYFFIYFLSFSCSLLDSEGKK